jgi:hypothetical protein
MPFSEAVKLEAKRRSDFQCAACRNPFVEVHHLIPQAENGPDTIDNACPLCARCHDLCGANPEKRKQLREMRDFQWELNAKTRQSPDVVALNQTLDGIQAQLNASASGQAQLLDVVKTLLIQHNNSSNVAISNASSWSGLTAATGIYIPPPEKV